MASQLGAFSTADFAKLGTPAVAAPSTIPNSPTTPVFNGSGTSVDQSGKAVPGAQNASQYFSTPVNPLANATSSAANSTLPQTPTSYPVVTSGAATSNYNNIQQDYNQNIAPNVNAAAQGQAAAKAQAAQVPTTTGFNPYSTAKTGNPGEISTTYNGQTFYATPVAQPATAGDIKGMLSGGIQGSVPPGWDIQTYQNFKAANPGLEPTPEDTAHMLAAGAQNPAQQASADTGINPNAETQNYTAAQQQNLQQLTSAYSTFSDTISKIQSGAFPLTPPQQALVDATNQAFNAMTTQQNLKAAALSSETGGVSNKINATAGEILNINSAQAASIAKLELGFQTQNYQMATDAYAAYTKFNTDKMSAVKDIHDTIMSTYNSALDAAQKEQTRQDTLAEQQRTYNLAVKQYDLSAANSAIDNKLKLAQTAKVYADMGAADISSAQSWVKNIQSGVAKFSDVPEALKNAVSVGIANGSPQGASALLTTTKQALDDLNARVNNDHPESPLFPLSSITGQNTGFSGAVGAKGISSLFGILGSPIPGTSAADFDAKLKQVTNDVVLPNLTILHGLGRVTDREFQALQSSITSLSPNLSENEFRDELKKVTDVVNQKVQDAQTEQQQAESKVSSGLNSIKTTNPTLYKAASTMYVSTNPETGQPYTPDEILQAFPELAK